AGPRHRPGEQGCDRVYCRVSDLERDDFSSNRRLALLYCWSMIPRVEPEGMLFRKPVSTFRDHALARICRAGCGLRACATQAARGLTILVPWWAGFLPWSA